MIRFAKQLRTEYRADRDAADVIWREHEADKPSRLRSAWYALAITLHERLSEVVCQALGHEFEKQPAIPYLICRRCLHEEEA